MNDLTLQIKRAIFTGLFTAGQTAPARAIMSRLMRADRPYEAVQAGEELLSRPWRVVALTAHPDDLEFFAGGTIRRMALAGCEITACVLTDGEKRSNLPNLGTVRKMEQLQAARRQGIKHVRFFGLTDFGLPEDPRLEPTVARIWEEEQPEVLLAFDPKELFPGFANRDHKALGRTVMDLSRRHYGRCRVYFYGTHQPNVLVNIGPVLKEKEDACLTHRSQMVYLKDEDYRRTVRLMARVASAGAPVPFCEPLYRLY